MKVASELNNHCIVYGSGNKIFAWHPSYSKPVLVAERSLDHHVTTISFIDGQLLDGGYNGIVRNSLTQQVIGEKPNPQSVPLVTIEDMTSDGPIFGIAKVDGHLLVLKYVEHLFRTKREDGVDYFYSGALLYKADDGRVIAKLGNRNYFPNYRGIELSFRSGSLGMAHAGNHLYVASQNILSLKGTSGDVPRIRKHTDYMADFVKLASNGQRAVSVHYHNHYSNPKGAEVRTLPDNRLLGTWKASKEVSVDGEQYGYPSVLALKDDILIVGTSNWVGDTQKRDIFGMSLKDGLKSFKSVELRPELLIENAFEQKNVYGAGNPMAIVPKRMLEHLVEQAA